MSRTLHRPSIRVQMHTCAPSIFENRAPCSCYHSTAWCLIADFHCFSPYYRVCHNFVWLGKGFTSTSRLYKIATYKTFVMFHGGRFIGKFGSNVPGIGGKFRDEPPHVVQVFQTSQGLWRLGPTCVWIPQLKQCILIDLVESCFDSEDFHWPFLSCT